MKLEPKLDQKDKPKKYYSDIAAYSTISESELALVLDDYSVDYFYEPTKKKVLDAILWELGMDTKQKYELQDVTQHRNKLGNVVTCGRYFGHERQDQEWLQSGLASQEAKDKAKSNRLVDEMYFQKGLTHSAQVAAEIKDKYRNAE